MYLGYTTTLASFLSLEFNRLNHPEEEHKVQVILTLKNVLFSCRCHIKTTDGLICICGPQMDREEMKLLSLLLAPVSRIHSYLSHIQVSSATQGGDTAHQQSHMWWRSHLIQSKTMARPVLVKIYGPRCGKHENMKSLSLFIC